jgi:hypothetical protein
MEQLHIEKPCSESWRKMQKNDEGRFCLSCQKTVVDFTDKTKEEIIDFLKAKKGEEVCGRCRTTHIAKPSRYRWLAGILALTFLLSSCWRRAQGCMAYIEPPKPEKHKKEIKSDTIHEQNFR